MPKEPDHGSAKKHYQSFIQRKNTKKAKLSKIVTLENQNIVNIKPVVIEHPKTSHKLYKTKKVGSSSSLYGDTKRVKIF